MTDEHPQRATTDPERDPRLARLLADEYGATESTLGSRVQSIMAAVARQSDEARPWWTTIANWSRALVPLGVSVATTAVVFLLRVPSIALTPDSVAYPDSLSRVTAVGILATRATSQDIAAALMSATADELLTAAVRK